ncbi:MAG: hypothetical protein AAFY78_05230 [Cyanobacteria bacterium J06648_16]
MPLDVQTKLPSPAFVLLSRSLYRTTRLRLPDESKTIPAIWIGDTAYSFFRTVATAEAALRLLQKLCDRNYPVALTQTAKGYALWTKETAVQAVSSVTPTAETPKSCYFLKAGQYREVSLRLPTLNHPVEGIEFNRQYYSVFCKEPELAQLVDLAGQLTEWGNPSLVLSNAAMLCVHEPAAQIV